MEKPTTLDGALLDLSPLTRCCPSTRYGTALRASDTVSALLRRLNSSLSCLMVEPSDQLSSAQL